MNQNGAFQEISKNKISTVKQCENKKNLTASAFPDLKPVALNSKQIKFQGLLVVSHSSQFDFLKRLVLT